MAGYDRLYYLRKAWALYPGVGRAVCAPFLAPHYAARRATRGPLRAGVDMLAALAFSAWIPWRARQVQRRFGLDRNWRAHAIRMARERFADPSDIALFGIERPEQLDAYIRRFEDAALNKRINPRGWTQDCLLADKRRFAARCRETGIRHAETLAIVADAHVEILGDPAGQPLLAKPSDGEGGHGVAPLGSFADAWALERALVARFGTRNGTWIVQPLLVRHPALADVALNALPTVRIVTMLDEQGVPEPVSATFRCASDPAAAVDNMKAGGLIAPVDLSDGRLGSACRGYGGDHLDAHPVTGAAILGRVLPDWQGALDLVVTAHARGFADYALIGWDVALTGDGPLLLEGNGKPGVLMPQRAARRGLGQGRYAELLAQHLRRAAETVP